MSSSFKIKKITKGFFWVEIKEADLRLCCGCPPDAVKFLNRAGEDENYRPNAILLSDARVQNGQMISFAEFPIMQMLYMQGMIANAGKGQGLPLIVGLKENVNAQLAYLCRGNYGCYTKAELLEGGCTPKEAERLYRVKLWFAEGKIYRPEELCKTLYLDDKAREIRNNVFIQRLRHNLFQISYKNEKIEIDLSDDEERVELPFLVRDRQFALTNFSVMHSGEGNGWNPRYPCMGSLLINNGKIYAIDAGPGFSEIINYFGLDVRDLEGLFLTHIHDDHFAGIPGLLHSCKRLKLFSAPLIKHTAQKKFAALMDLDDRAIGSFFDVVDLAPEAWNTVDGMEVMPVLSPHPVETNLFLFRKKAGAQVKTYAHLADTVSFENLDKIKTIDENAFPNLKQQLLAYADIKKVDIGGGFIHGEKADYRDDDSRRIVFSHNDRPSYRENGEECIGAQFGNQDILIEGKHIDYEKAIFCNILQNNFPDVSEKECLTLYENGKNREKRRNELFYVEDGQLCVILTGNISYFNVSFDEKTIFSRDHIMGLCEFFASPEEGYRVNSSFVRAVYFSKSAFLEVMKEKTSWKALCKKADIVKKLAGSALFSRYSSSALVFHLAQNAGYCTAEQGETLNSGALDDLYILQRGEASYVSESKKLKLKQGDFFGGNQLFANDYKNYEVALPVASAFVKIPAAAIENIPLVLWKVYENCTTLNHICKTK